MIRARFRILNVVLLGAVVLALGPFCAKGLAFERYNSCASCHGSFTGSTSPKGTVFPGGDKHQMHRSSGNMETACDLCHKSGDNRNPFIGSSNGTANNPGLGCIGCHEAAGLRAHHDKNGITSCVGCHGAEVAPPEGTKPPYYGTADTKADDPSNSVQAANMNENWSVGDFIGLDNDGDNLYDLADFDCGPPYRLVSVTAEGDDLRITWETAGGRTDAIQASDDVGGDYSPIGPVLTIGGVGLVTTNYLEAGGATSLSRFYRVSSAP